MVMLQYTTVHYREPAADNDENKARSVFSTRTIEHLVPGTGIECRKSKLLGTKYLPYLESRYQVQSSKSNFVLYSKVVLDFFI